MEKKHTKIIKLFIYAVIVLVFGIIGSIKYYESSKAEVINVTNDSYSYVHFIDVGQGDCALVISDGEYMLVDAGEENYGSIVVDYLKKQNIDKLKYIVATHPHSDHIGGLDDVMKEFSVENVIMPDCTNNSRSFDNLLNAIENSDAKVINGTKDVKFNVGKFNCNVVGPVNINDDDINNNSVVIKLSYGNDDVLLTGDCSRDEENDIINSGEDISADVLKAGHHGSSTASSKNFIAKVKPSVAVISCGLNNDYGHPHSEVVNRFNNYGITMYRTDELGTIIAKCTGNGIEISHKNNTTNVPENNNNSALTSDNKEVAESNSSTKVSINKYVLNIKTKKIHKPDCSSVNKIKNKEEYTGLIDDLIEKGYSKCKICNPE